MTSALAVSAAHDQTALPNILRSGVKLGLLQCVLIAAFAVLPALALYTLLSSFGARRR